LDANLSLQERCKQVGALRWIKRTKATQGLSPTPLRGPPFRSLAAHVHENLVQAGHA